MSNRLEKFRHVIALLDPIAGPLQATGGPIYVSANRPISSEVSARLELRPSSSHLVVGGIGSGKTTELIFAVRRLRDIKDTWAVYIDVSRRHDLSALESGVLIVIAGLALGQLLKGEKPEEKTKKSMTRFHDWANGSTFYVPINPDDDYDPAYDDQPDGDYEVVTTPPVLRPPNKPLSYDIRSKQDELNTIFREVQKRYKHVVLVFDSLDRLADSTIFSKVVNEDIRAIQEVGIGIAIAGPLQILYGQARSITDHFDYFYHKAAVEVSHDLIGLEFLTKILEVRDPGEIIPPEVREKLARFSGGVLRDLILLAQTAVEEAYLSGAEKVAASHVDYAADNLGRKYMIGLTSDQIEVLQKVRASGNFVVTSDLDISLLVTRRILEFSSEFARFGVHPTIEPLLLQLLEQKS